MATFIYHIRYPEHKNKIDYGYIGLTNNKIRRKAEHWTALTLNSHSNHKIQNAFNDRPDDIEFVIYKEFENRDDASLLEETLRPIKNIGWNIAVGGERIYKERFNEKTFNIENDFIDDRLLAQKFNFIDEKFTKIQSLSRKLFKPFVDNWSRSKHAVITKNLLNEYDIENKDHNSTVAMEMVFDAWSAMPSIFNGNWGAVPHDMTSAAFAISIKLNSNTEPLNIKLNLLMSLGAVIQEMLINGSLYRLNQIDAFLIDQIFISYFSNLSETDLLDEIATLEKAG